MPNGRVTPTVDASPHELETENERLRRAVTELSALNDLARAIGASVGLNDVLHRIVNRSIKSHRVEEGVIALVDAKRDEAHTLARVNEQIRLAAAVQMHLLPDTIPAIAGCEVAGTSLAAEVIGNHTYNVVRFQDGRVALCLADVADNGLPVSVLMANVPAIVRFMGTHRFSCCDTMSHANELPCRCTMDNRFVTSLLLILDLSSGELEFCNVGHNPRVVATLTADCERLTTKGAVLRMIHGVADQGGRRHLSPGEVPTIVPDGVTEAVNPKDKEFGDDRLVELLLATPRRDAASTVSEPSTAIRSQASDRRQSDDITLLVLRRAEDAEQRRGAA